MVFGCKGKQTQQGMVLPRSEWSKQRRLWTIAKDGELKEEQAGRKVGKLFE
jgi:hypothetical protein